MTISPSVCPSAGTSRSSSSTTRSEEHTSELQSRQYLVCRLLLEKKNRDYPNGLDIRDGDRLDEQGSGADNAKSEAARVQGDPRYADRMYGRVVYVRNANDAVVGAWLQYWLYYFFIEYPAPNAADPFAHSELVPV